MKNTANTKKTIAAVAAAVMTMSTLAGCGQTKYPGAGYESDSVDIIDAESADRTAEENQTDEYTIEISDSQLTTKIGSGIGSLSKEISNSIFELTDPYYGQGVVRNAELSSKNVKLYTGGQDEDESFVTEDTTLYFMDEEKSVPYMRIDDLVKTYNTVLSDPTDEPSGADLGVNGQKYDDMYIMSRNNGAMVYFDFADNDIWLIKPDQFSAYDTAATPLDIIQMGSTDEDEFLRHTKINYIEGNDLCIDLDAYGIHLIEKDGEFYCPVTTFSNLFFSKFYLGLAYNTEDLFVVPYGSLGDSVEEATDYGKIYYKPEQPKNRSKALKTFTYSDICLACDYHYGLKEEHDITSFNEYFYRTGLYEELLSDDINVYSKALHKLTMLNLADKHSAVDSGSVYTGDISLGNYFETDYDLIYSIISMMTNPISADSAREEYYGDSEPSGYTEIGDTAFITFDSFLMDEEKDYMTCELENDAYDTVDLALYSHAQITREGSPIKKVVMNLANNGGGQVDAALSIISWYTGSSGMLSLKNMTSSAESTTVYSIDANRDGTYDPSTDTLAGLGLDLYCVISDNSFSCGNLTPAAFKASGNVTLLGQTSGGGACVVQPLMTADGVMYQISGQSRINIVKNGSYYSVDEGVEPDVFIAENNNLFNNEYISELIHSIN